MMSISQPVGHYSCGLRCLCCKRYIIYSCRSPFFSSIGQLPNWRLNRLKQNRPPSTSRLDSKCWQSCPSFLTRQRLSKGKIEKRVCVYSTICVYYTSLYFILQLCSYATFMLLLCSKGLSLDSTHFMPFSSTKVSKVAMGWEPLVISYWVRKSSMHC